MFASPPERTFRDSLTRRIAAGLLFFALLAWGVYDRRDSGEFDRLVWEFIVAAGALFGFVLIRSAGRRIEIHPEGISYVSLFRQADLTWEEIASTRYQQQSIDMVVNSELLLPLFYALADKTDFMLPTLWITGQRTIRIGPSIRDGHEAIGLVLAKVDSRLMSEARRFLDSGAAVTFGKISVSPAGVAWKTRIPIPWNEISECRLEGRRLRIRRQGRLYDSIVVRSKKVPNIFVLMDMIESRMTSTARPAAIPEIPGVGRSG